MFAWLRDLFTTGPFMPHGHCYMWEPGLLWLQVLSNGLIGLSYIAIAAGLGWLAWRGRYVPFKGMALAFGAFIITCGLTHFFDIYVIWEPVYWLDGTVRAVTAVASVGTALFLPALLPRAIVLARGARMARERGVELEHAVDDLSQLYEKTRELDVLKTQFFANVSHELRTPLTLILGPAERMLANDNLTDDQRRDTEVISRNARTLLRHVNDLLDVARLESGRLEPDYARTDLAESARLLAANFDGVAAEREIDFQVRTPRELPAEIDPQKTQRVIQNLLSNAFKFTPSGGAVRLELVSDGEQATLEVADSGPGIPADQRDLVFTRFRQADGSSTRKFGGTGLGLAISRDFVELHGGSIEVGEAPEGGALLRVVLPLGAPEGAEVADAQDEEDGALSEETRQLASELRDRVESLAPTPEGEEPLVLVVEDNPDMNRFLSETLGGVYRTETAHDGRVGLEKALEVKPDLILTDVMMPEMSGEELVRSARERPELDNVPIVLLTAMADAELRVRLLREGAQDYITKPFSAGEVLARVGNLITLKRARDVLQREIETQMRDVEQLAQEVTHRKRELNTALESMRVAREQAERASRVKTSFLGMVSHELRTPLATLELQLEQLRLEEEEKGGSGEEPGSPLLRRIRVSSARLRELIDSLLQYVRLESGGLALRRESFDTVRLAEEAADELRPATSDRGLTLTCEAPGEIPPLTSDQRLVHIVVVNLLGNAVKFTRKGSIALRVSYRDGHHVFSVEDSGPGIPPEKLSRVFEPFEQGEPVRHKHVPGVGLGLALVHEIVQALGGRVTVDSEVGKGSTFTVEIPEAPGERERE